MEYTDQYYLDSANAVHFLSASDQAYAVEVGLSLPDPSWTLATAAQVNALLNPPITLSQAKINQVALVDAACAAAITSGFISSALGSPYAYPAGPTDQSNLMGSVTASLIPAATSSKTWSTPFWCQDAEGNWSFLAHNATQIQQVGLDASADIAAKIGQKIKIESQINSSEVVADIQAMVWTNPS